ncbi:MAG: hypothetical protein GF317_22760 [Candidatus Lokiarchaeota archaeon]|nr:hypothetical protein [Candidatus Lokiarchaeota archaeon]
MREIFGEKEIDITEIETYIKEFNQYWGEEAIQKEIFMLDIHIGWKKTIYERARRESKVINPIRITFTKKENNYIKVKLKIDNGGLVLWYETETDRGRLDIDYEEVKKVIAFRYETSEGFWFTYQNNTYISFRVCSLKQ